MSATAGEFQSVSGETPFAVVKRTRKTMSVATMTQVEDAMNQHEVESTVQVADDERRVRRAREFQRILREALVKAGMVEEFSAAMRG